MITLTRKTFHQPRIQRRRSHQRKYVYVTIKLIVILDLNTTYQASIQLHCAYQSKCLPMTLIVLFSLKTNTSDWVWVQLPCKLQSRNVKFVNESCIKEKTNIFVQWSVHFLSHFEFTDSSSQYTKESYRSCMVLTAVLFNYLSFFNVDNSSAYHYHKWREMPKLLAQGSCSDTLCTTHLRLELENNKNPQNTSTIWTTISVNCFIAP